MKGVRSDYVNGSGYTSPVEHAALKSAWAEKKAHSFIPALSPCPFCGGEARYSVREQQSKSTGAMGYSVMVRCMRDRHDCRAQMQYWSRDQMEAKLIAAEAWNRREKHAD